MGRPIQFISQDIGALGLEKLKFFQSNSYFNISLGLINCRPYIKMNEKIRLGLFLPLKNLSLPPLIELTPSESQ